jgi:hypothetical protein
LINYVLFENPTKYGRLIRKVCHIINYHVYGRDTSSDIRPSNILLLQLYWHYLFTYYVLIISRIIKGPNDEHATLVIAILTPVLKQYMDLISQFSPQLQYDIHGLEELDSTETAPTLSRFRSGCVISYLQAMFVRSALEQQMVNQDKSQILRTANLLYKFSRMEDNTFWKVKADIRALAFAALAITPREDVDGYPAVNGAKL